MTAVVALVQAALAAILSVLLLAASNRNRGLELADLKTPVVLAVSFAILAWIVAGTVARSERRRGLVAVLFTSAMVFYGYFAAPIEGIVPLGSVGRAAVTMCIVTVVLALIGRKAGGSGRSKSVELERGITAGLVTMVIVVSIPVATGLRTGLPSDAGHSEARAEEPTNSGGAMATAPDIFLIILDAYSRGDHLLEFYGLDNADFVRELERREFQIPSRARANYTSTFQAVAAMLNMDYLQELGIELDPESTDRHPVYRVLEDNLTARELQSLGYEFVFLASSLPALSRNRVADIQIPERAQGEFTQFFAARTILSPLVLVYCSVTRCHERWWPFTPEGPEQLRAKFASLGRLAGGPRPRFVLAHFLLPHEPFRVDSACAPIEPVWPSKFDEEEERRIRLLYAMHVRCTNQLVLRSVDEIVANSTRDPILIIQADHGYGRFPWGRATAFESTDRNRVRERMSVFAAYRFPGDAPPLVPDTISPVNVFRLIFTRYFGRADLSPLEDRGYWSEWDRPFLYTRVGPDGRAATTGDLRPRDRR